MKPIKSEKHRRIEFSALSSLIGQELGCSDWVEIAQADVDKFADASGDHEWIHVDVPRATKAFGAPVVHHYRCCLCSSQSVDRNRRDAGISLSQRAPRGCVCTSIVHVGQRVRLRQKMIDCASKQGGLLAQKEVVVEIEHEDRPALVADAFFCCFPKATGPVAISERRF